MHCRTSNSKSTYPKFQDLMLYFSATTIKQYSNRNKRKKKGRSKEKILKEKLKKFNNKQRRKRFKKEESFSLKENRN